MTVSKTRIDILRHGEPLGGRKYRGHGVDDPLSELGWRQMWSAVGEDWPWELIVTSPMSRCRPFAETLGDRAGLVVTIDERLKEVGFGTWEGRTSAELRAEDSGQLQRFYDNPVLNRPAGAESLDAFRDRIGAAVADILRFHRGRRVLVVAHAGVMRAAASWLFEAPLENMYRMDVPNAAFLRITADGERPAMIALEGPSLG